MPHSKTIVNFIKNAPAGFNSQQLAKKMMSSGMKQKKSKNKKSNEREYIDQINETLAGLASIGYVVKNRKSFSVNPEFSIEGVIKISPRGFGIIKTDAGDEIKIFSEYLDSAHSNDFVEADIIDYFQGEYFGAVTKIIRRSRETYFARIEQVTAKHIFYRLLDTPVSTKVCSQKNESITEQGGFAEIKLLETYIADYQECSLVRKYSQDEYFDVHRITIKHSLPKPHRDYTELERFKDKKNYMKELPQSEFRNRKNYKKQLIVTIDGDHAKDFDDAVSIERGRGKWTLYVHIADVSAFVSQNSDLDKEASARGTSYYLGNSVIPMLPEILSNDLCSLRENEERLTLSAEIDFDDQGNTIASRFHRGLICVNKRLTYKTADAMIGKKSTKIASMLTKMFELANILKEKRLLQGRIDLTLPESEAVFDISGLTDLVFAERLRSHFIIEEFMLSANEVVSKALSDNNVPALFRIHETISEEKLYSLRKFFQTLNLHPGKTKNIGLSLQKVLDEVKGKRYEKVVNFIILKSFMQAYYGPQPLGHFGLGFEDYTHFTSPIRRYPDLIVHRCLKNLIDKAQYSYDLPHLEIIGEKSSDLERIAQNAERDLIKLFCCRIMQDKVGEKFDAVISGISRFGFFVSLLNKPIEGMVHLKYLTDDYYLIKEDEYTVIGKRFGKRFRLGDLIKVRLMEVSYDTMRIDFDVAKK